MVHIMRVALVIPSLITDEPYLKQCLKGIEALDPAPECVLINRNDGGGGLRDVRGSLFDSAFKDYGCDVALQCSSDFLLHPDILKYVEGDRITTFSFFARKRSMPILAMKFLASPGMWTGCYSLPKESWERMKGFDGTDSSVKQWAIDSSYPIKKVRIPKYRLLRPTVQMDAFERELSLDKRILKMVSWF